jgi:DNA-damage-inducible protein D
MSTLISKEYQEFEQIKHTDEAGNEFWFARELAPVLEYAKWENFSKVIDRAMLACKNRGFDITDQFPEVRKLIEHGKSGKRKVVDYKLTRYACYLIVQNGDPRKEIIATIQTYFAIQTRQHQEVRKTIERVGGVLPENQPTPDKSIEEVKREQLKKLKSQKKLMLDE